jgi:hypothetical protein
MSEYPVYSFISFSRFYGSLSSMPKEEAEQLQETENEGELEDEEEEDEFEAHDNESPLSSSG